MSLKCDLCHKPDTIGVNRVTDTGTYFICDECRGVVTKTNELIAKSDSAYAAFEREYNQFHGKLSGTPKTLVAELDKTIIGQQDAKKTLALGVYTHLKRCHFPDKFGKTNILLIGPTGTGKTMLAETIAKTAGVPFGVADATTITQTGWAGEDAETVLLDLYHKCKGDVARVERGIVFIDEIDKLAARGDAQHKSHSYGAQKSLLKLLDGAEVTLSPNGNRKTQSPDDKKVVISTRNILFILGGAFAGLDDKELAPKESIGLTATASKKEASTLVISKQLEEYGFMAEFVGRMGAAVRLLPLEKSDLREILTKPVGSLVNEYTELFAIDKAKLDFTSTGLEAIASHAHSLCVGGRGLRTVLELLFRDVLYNIDEHIDETVQVDAEFVNETLKERI